MFDLRPYKILNGDLHRIVNNRTVLFNDGDNDVLYTGTNSYGTYIIGSIVFEDDERGFLRYFHVLVSDQQLNDFLNQKIALRKILQDNNGFFAVDMDYTRKELDYNVVIFSDIDNKYLPLDDSFCPKINKPSTLTYTFSLKGGLSDLHKADPLALSSTNTTLCAFIKSSIGFVNDMDLTVSVFSEPSKTGSFELNFEIEFKELQLSLFSKPHNDINNFIRNYFNYVIDKLPSEDDGIFKDENVNSNEFRKLESDFVELHNNRNIAIRNSASKQEIIELINKSVDNLKNIDYNGFNRIQITNNTANNEKDSIGIINNEYYHSIERKVDKPQQLVIEDVIEIDKEPKEYRIQIYSLNKETGFARAYFQPEGKPITKVQLYLTGRSDYQNTIFAKNINEPDFISIKAIGKSINGVLQELRFSF